MTLSDVIDTLQTWIRNADDEYDREEMGRVAGLKEALHEIKRIEPCEDCISRQAVIDTLTKTSGIRGDALKALYDLPPVTPQPKTGHWEDTDTTGCIFYCRCSICGEGIQVDAWYTKNMHYCPNCGAKMAESEDKE